MTTLTKQIRAPYDNINVTSKQIYTMSEIIPYVNPLKPETTYYKVSYGDETYHHTDKAIVKKWLIEQILITPYKKEKQRITERAINSFYKK